VGGRDQGRVLVGAWESDPKDVKKLLSAPDAKGGGKRGAEKMREENNGGGRLMLERKHGG